MGHAPIIPRRQAASERPLLSGSDAGARDLWRRDAGRALVVRAGDHDVSVSVSMTQTQVAPSPGPSVSTAACPDVTQASGRVRRRCGGPRRAQRCTTAAASAMRGQPCPGVRSGVAHRRVRQPVRVWTGAADVAALVVRLLGPARCCPPPALRALAHASLSGFGPSGAAVPRLRRRHAAESARTVPIGEMPAASHRLGTSVRDPGWRNASARVAACPALRRRMSRSARREHAVQRAHRPDRQQGIS